MNLCDISYVKSLLARHGFRFSKTLGQNFLTQSWVPEQTADMCGCSHDTGVLEVGPGIGTLTRPLAKRACEVVSIEIDRALLPILSETLSDLDNVKIINGDVMKLDLRKIINENFSCKNVVACANLPYYITTPVISLLLESGCFSSITVMVQKEVAERIAARPGTPDYGAFTVFVNYHADAEILFNVGAECFIPQPKVDSAVVKLKVRKPNFHIEDSAMYFRVVKSAFGQRRKTLANALGNGLGKAFSKEQIKDALLACGFAEDVRGERLSPEDFAKLSNLFSGLGETNV